MNQRCDLPEAGMTTAACAIVDCRWRSRSSLAPPLQNLNSELLSGLTTYLQVLVHINVAEKATASGIGAGRIANPLFGSPYLA
jgi:hypothetical protein